MSAYVNVSASDDTVDVSDRTADLGAIVIRIGTAGIHLDPDAARKLATDILAALSAPVSS